MPARQNQLSFLVPPITAPTCQLIFQYYDFEMGVIKDETQALQFPRKDDMISIISLENGVVKNIEFKPTLP